jgi:hypothetical protein
MSISVVIPLYNKAETILKAVASVRAQTFSDWELVVFDDGSTDGGLVLVEALDDPRIRCVRQVNAGVAAARNAGLRLARSEWVALLDADDYWRSDHLMQLHQLRHRFPQAALCGAAYRIVNHLGEERDARLSEAFLSVLDGMACVEDFFLEVHQHGMPFFSSSLMLRKDVALACGGFPVGVIAGEDLVMWARMACAGMVALSTHRTSFYVEPSQQAALRQQIIRRPQEPDLVAVLLAALRDAHPERASLQVFCGDWHRMRAVLWMELNERRRCVRELIKAVQTHGLTLKDAQCLVALLLPSRVRADLLARVRASR